MGRQWISLLIFGFAICAVVIGWDAYLSFSGFRSDFTYAVNQINSGLYERVSPHLQQSPKFAQYQEKAISVQSVDEFFPTAD